MEIIDALLSADLELGDLVAWVIVDLHPCWEDQLDVSVYMVDHSKFERRREVFFQNPAHVLYLFFAIFIYSNDLRQF